jgi:hypothetical protein
MGSAEREVDRASASLDADRVAAEMTDLALAGARLVHAIYHSSPAAVTAMPRPVLDAYMEACRVYQVGRS